MSAQEQLVTREIITIDEELCDGCGLCVPACAEGALQIIDGKARLVSDVYCDGMGACLGHCPQDAIHIERRAAAEFDEAAVEARLTELAATSPPEPASAPAPEAEPVACGCPSSLSRSMAPPVDEDEAPDTGAAPRSQLRNWPVELKLAPLEAPYYDQADILISADCVPFAHADFHRKFLKGRTLLIGCPKLDDAQFYQNKLTAIFSQNDVRSVEIAFMEVPCCIGLVALVKQALAECGKEIKASARRVGIQGDELETYDLAALPF